MESKWEEFARDDPMYYIDTSAGSHPGGDKEKQFFQSGKAFADQTIHRVREIIPDKDRALEIGCGVGRLTLPHAAHFNEIIAVDISATMLEKLSKKAEGEGFANIHTFLRDEQWDEKPISYAYSYLVFQHVANLGEIENYIKKIAGCLKKNGIAQLQFDTRTADFAYQLRSYLPDALLPRNQKRGIRRIRRDAAALRTIFQENEMKVVEEIGPETAVHYFILKKNAGRDE